MTYKTDLQTNNTNLQSILDKVNALPEAGGGNTDIEDGLVNRTLINYENNRITSVGNYVFYNYDILESVDLSNVTLISEAAFRSATSLKTLILRSETVCSLMNKNSLLYTRIDINAGHIYVPSSLLNDYKTDTNWMEYADQIVAIEDYPNFDAYEETKDAEGKLIFYIEDNLYKAEEGMNWADWCSSDYNTYGYYVGGLGDAAILFTSGLEEYCIENSKYGISPDDKIIAGYSYIHAPT